MEHENRFYPVASRSWEELLASPELHAYARAAIIGVSAVSFDVNTALAPVQSQEVWAAGVTYFRSCDARMEESKDVGGGTFYDRVYAAERPEPFFKASGRRVVGPNAPVRIRADATWSVPEAELTLSLDPQGSIAEYNIGNGMSSRDIEEENLLYLPQAKVYHGSCAIGGRCNQHSY